jgi:hypothetical protein
MAVRAVYRVNRPRVIFEIIEGELILVNLEQGCYFSVDAVGAEVWTLLESGHSVSDVVDALRFRYAGDPHDIGASVQAFVDMLLTEELIVLDPAAAPPEAPAPPAASERPAFRVPELQKYTDMRDMLLLDPVHDVEAAGWPVPKLDDAWPEPDSRTLES